MKELFGIAIMSVIGLSASNFIWEAFTSQVWGVALERSYFQFLAIVAFTTVLLAFKKDH